MFLQNKKYMMFFFVKIYKVYKKYVYTYRVWVIKITNYTIVYLCIEYMIYGR